MEPDEIIENLVRDPTDVPDVRVLVGYLGRSARGGFWRLYFTPDLRSFVEFREDEVVHSKRLDRKESPLGGTVVWVRREANLKRTQATSREAQADFLQGAIRARLAQRNPPVGRRPLVAQVLPFTPSFHFYSICDELAAPSFMSGGDVFCGGSFECSTTWEAECP